MAVLGYSPKLKMSLGLAFGAHFKHDFSTQIFLNTLFNTLSISIHTFFPSPDIKQKVLLSSYLDS